MAVHNGAPLLREKLDHLLNLDYPAAIEVIVVSDGSYDGTNEIMGEVTDPRLVSIICSEHRGKAAALNHGIQRAIGDILVFIDIRPRLEPNALRQLLSNFADPNVGCVAGELCLRTDDHDTGSNAVSDQYWRYEQWLRKCEALVDSPVGVYGGFYAVRQELATSLPEGLILDDMYQPLCIVRQGFRSVLDDSARVWDVWPKTSAGEFNRKVRTLAGNYQLLERAPWLLGRANRLRFQLISHKLLRLVAPFLFLLLMVTNSVLHAAQPYSTFLLMQALFYGLATVGFLWEIPIVRRLAGPASGFTLLNAAAVVALFTFLLRPNSLLGLWAKGQPAAEVRPRSPNLTGEPFPSNEL
jgi:cellulose synthase/poly-beta-1,6-N-acetylglucosamine synthase-like glycosyltransferase